MSQSRFENKAPRALRDTFGRLAEVYDDHAVLEREVADRLLERLDFQRLAPDRIADLGCGTGYCAAVLKRRYRRAAVIAVDHALAMCRQAKSRSRLMRPILAVCGDLGDLPMAGRSLDLVVANLSFQWTDDAASLFNGLRRVIRPKGLVLFSALGPASLRELREAGSTGASGMRMRDFPDMHETGDALVAAGFDEPVMDSEVLTIEYRTIDELLGDLVATGASTHCAGSGNLSASRLDAAWPVRNGRYPLSWEIVYGAAFGPPEGRPVKSANGDVATFSVEALRGARGHH